VKAITVDAIGGGSMLDTRASMGAGSARAVGAAKAMGQHGAAIGGGAVDQRGRVRALHLLVLQVEVEQALDQAEAHVGRRE
jgi:hypothetical protein